MVVDMHGLDIPQEIKQTSESQAILERCLPWLLKSYSNQSTFKTLKLPQNVFDNLVKHPRYSMCMLILKDMFPDLTSCPVSVFTMILCTARDTVDCSKAFELVVYNSTPSTKIYVEEFLYELCTYMLVFQRLYNLPPFTQHTLYLSLPTHQHTTLSLCQEKTMVVTWWATYWLWLKCLIGEDMRQSQGKAIKYEHELMLLNYFRK